MDVLELLIEERDRLNKAIESLVGSEPSRRGRQAARSNSGRVKEKGAAHKRARRGRPSRIIAAARSGRLLKRDIERVVAEKG